MRQAHYLLRPLGDPTPSAKARTFLAWLDHLDQIEPALLDAEQYREPGEHPLNVWTTASRGG